jgi:hypothetical protein
MKHDFLSQIAEIYDLCVVHVSVVKKTERSKIANPENFSRDYPFCGGQHPFSTNN